MTFFRDIRIIVWNLEIREPSEGMVTVMKRRNEKHVKQRSRVRGSA